MSDNVPRIHEPENLKAPTGPAATRLGSQGCPLNPLPRNASSGPSSRQAAMRESDVIRCCPLPRIFLRKIHVFDYYSSLTLIPSIIALRTYSKVFIKHPF